MVLLHWYREVTKFDCSGSLWEEAAQRVIPPYAKQSDLLVVFLSTVGHVKPRGNPGGPSSKAKYYLTTDSERVP